MWCMAMAIVLSSCNLFRQGIEGRKREKSGITAPKEEKAAKENKSERVKKANSILATAHKYDGAPYKMGGETKSGIDCSALVMLSYKSAGIVLPRTSMEQSKQGQEIPLEKAQVGDLIFFKFKSKSHNPVNHVGIVSKVDSGGLVYFYHASTSLGVTESSLAESYYRNVFVKLMRVY